MSTWASSLIGPGRVSLFLFPSNFLFVLFTFYFLSFFTWCRAEYFAEGRLTSLFVKFFFHIFFFLFFFQFEFFFFFFVVLGFAIEHPFIMYWSPRCVTAPKPVRFFLSVSIWGGNWKSWRASVISSSSIITIFFFFALWRRDNSLFVSDENNKTYNLKFLIFPYIFVYNFFFSQ